ncbi:MAG TPA: DNA recombination protein RmuC [Coleofasciculaceae cyanobacterium]|jgi:DNA recombination protein RmuC
MEVIFGLIVGLILGGGSVWLITRSQIQTIKFQKQASDEKANLFNSQREKLLEENEQKQTIIQQLEKTIKENEQEIRNTIKKSSDADAKLEKTSNLEARLLVETENNQRLRNENTAHKENISRLAADLESQKQHHNQIIIKLENDLNQINLEITDYKREIEQAHKMSAEANAQREYIEELKQENTDFKQQNEQLKLEKARFKEELSSLKTKLEEERKSTQEKIELLQNAEQKLTNAFESLSSRALQNNNQQFLQAAKATFENIYQTSQHKIDAKHQAISDLISPLNRSLEAFDKKLNNTDNAWSRDKGQISEQLQSQAALMYRLQSETANLTQALRQPIVRGRWGEVQLRRVVEISGMQEHCDFTIQETVVTEEGRNQRPDLIVTLPSQKKVIVDSKAPLKAYLEALEMEEESEKINCLKNHAKHIRSHINQLSSKNYWIQFDNTPEFVVMFLPGEVFFSAALQQDPSLIEYGIERKVILATPTTLITLLRTIEYGWRQEQIARNTQEIGNLGRELYDRFTVFANHLDTLRKKLDETVKTYNKAVGSYNSRLLVTAKKFEEIGGYGNEQIDSIDTVDQSLRIIAQDDD